MKLQKNNSIYKKVFSRLKAFTVCNYMGATNEYVKMNSVIQNFILRNSFKVADDINQYLNKNIEEFKNNVENKEYTDYLDFTEFVYYIKENLKKEVKFPPKFLYSTVFLRTVIELYNKKDHKRVISIVKSIKENGMFSMYDIQVKRLLQFYFCRSLARENSSEFEAEVEFFKEDNDYVKYNFLKGFNYRIQGNYNYAESSYRKVLKRNNGNRKAKRELVIIYTNLQEFDTALDLAEYNYRDDSENIYQIQAYFDCLIRKKDLNDKQGQDLEDMLSTITRIHRNKPCDIYYQIEAKNEAFRKNNKERAIKYLKDGLNKFPGSIYILRDLFDVNRRFNDVDAMQDIINKLEAAIKNNNTKFETILISRRAFLEAYQGKSRTVIEISLNKYKTLSDNSKENILNKVDDILSMYKY